MASRLLLGLWAGLDTAVTLAIDGRDQDELIALALLRGLSLALAAAWSSRPSKAKLWALSGAWYVGLAMAAYPPLLLLLLDEAEGGLARYAQLEPACLQGLAWSFAASLAYVGILWLLLILAPRKTKAKICVRPEDPDCVEQFQDQEEEAETAEEDMLSFAETLAIVRRLCRYCLGEWMLFIPSSLILLTAAVANILMPLCKANLLNALFITRSAADFSDAFLLFLGLQIACHVLGQVQSLLADYAEERLLATIKRDLFTSLLAQDMGFFDTTPTWEPLNCLEDHARSMAQAIIKVLAGFLSQMTAGCIALYVLLIMTLLLAPFIAILKDLCDWVYEKMCAPPYQFIVLGNIKTVKTFGAEELEIERYVREMWSLVTFILKNNLRRLSPELFRTGLDVAFDAATYLYGGHLVFNGRLKPMDFFCFTFYESSLTGVAMVFSFMDRPPAFLCDGTYLPDYGTKGALTFRDVHFAYPSRPLTPVIKGMCFQVGAGEMVALVGPSGGGKSTIVSLLSHFYEPQSGAVLLDGVPLGDYDNRYFHRQVSLVAQEPILFAGSVTHNILYGLRKGEEELEKEEAARLANAHDFVQGFPSGYCTDVGEDGSQVSGGQRQRLAIARTLVRGPQVVFLDEATSSLDAESEYLVQEAVYKTLAGRTVVVIAHRLSTVKRANRILVIDQGEIVEEGSHTELLKQDGLYRSLVQRQLFHDTD